MISTINVTRMVRRAMPASHDNHDDDTRKDTRGCILVGENTIVGHVQNSKYWLKVINDRVFAALQAKDTVIIKIT